MRAALPMTGTTWQSPSIAYLVANFHDECLAAHSGLTRWEWRGRRLWHCPNENATWRAPRPPTMVVGMKPPLGVYMVYGVCTCIRMSRAIADVKRGALSAAIPDRSGLQGVPSSTPCPSALSASLREMVSASRGAAEHAEQEQDYRRTGFECELSRRQATLGVAL